MVALVALAKRIANLEALPTQQTPLKVEGCIIPGFAHPSLRATLKLPSGHVVVVQRQPTESLPAFITRISRPGTTLVLGGLPPLPIDSPNHRHFPPYLLGQPLARP
jgi:hypothetical protein